MSETHPSLRSEFYREPHVPLSMYPCKRLPQFPDPFLISTKQEKRVKLAPNGPLSVSHIESGIREKVGRSRSLFREKMNPNLHLKKRALNPKGYYNSPFSYFDLHRYCDETQYYWRDIRHPQIRRHYHWESRVLFCYFVEERMWCFILELKQLMKAINISFVIDKKCYNVVCFWIANK